MQNLQYGVNYGAGFLPYVHIISNWDIFVASLDISVSNISAAAGGGDFAAPALRTSGRPNPGRALLSHFVLMRPREDRRAAAAQPF